MAGLSGLRVFYAVHNHTTEDANLLAGLRQTGVEVIPYDHGHPFEKVLGPDWTEAYRAAASEQLVDAVTREHARRPVDLLFAYVMSPLILPEAIRRIRQLGIVTVNYWCNNAHQFYLVREIAPAFDYCAVPEWHSLQAYRDAGATPLYFQMAANPEIYRPYELPREFDVTFVGQRYADRPVYVAFLLKNGIDVRIWGPGWTADRTFGEKLTRYPLSYLWRHPRAGTLRLLWNLRSRLAHVWEVPPWDEFRLSRASGRSLPLAELVAMYSRSRLSLGFSTVGDQRYRDRNKIRQIHQRDFEAPMSAAFYFTEHMEELANFYRIGEEVITYGSREDLLEKVRFFLGQPELAERIRRAGYERARRDHTWKRRFDDLLAAVARRPSGNR